MMMKRVFVSLIGLCTLALGGCASAEQYAAYVAAETARAEAKATADVAKYKALALIGASGGETARVAALISINGNGPQAPAGLGLAPPKLGGEAVLQWASILVPGLMQAYGINRQTALGIVQSNNALAATQSSNSTMLGFGQLINAPVVVEQPAPVVVTQPAPVIVRPEVVAPEVIQVPTLVPLAQ